MRKKILLLGMSVMMLFGIVGCNDESNNTNVNYYSKDKLVHLHQIESDREDLYYDDETGIVYFLFDLGVADCKTGYMCPYYSKNGKLCKYENGQIMEIMEK
ncbi:hypothetical protein [Anaerobutyricum hallii]|uniref:hypothetical protein n=1 Tax=Anaerobutyricum hallii TaxID=39488 RepID=UPI001ADDE5F4|nr:hypothetical protein [Anaerobutyricum hallii]